MSLVGFELAIPASERPHTHALDRAATGFGIYIQQLKKIKINLLIKVEHRFEVTSSSENLLSYRRE
jgi:hypothetical protein